jgi:hypothetical protein
MYQGRQVSPSVKHDQQPSNLRRFVAGIAMKNMATIRVIVPKRRRYMEPRWQKPKKMRVKVGLQVLDPAKMGLQVLNPAKGWCNGQVRPRVVPHGNDNHECSNSAFFQREKSKECVGSMCHTIERTDRQGYPNF